MEKKQATTEERRIAIIKDLKEMLPQKVVDDIGLEEMTFEQIKDLITKALRGIARDVLEKNDDV